MSRPDILTGDLVVHTSVYDYKFQFGWNCRIEHLPVSLADFGHLYCHNLQRFVLSGQQLQFNVDDLHRRKSLAFKP